MAEKKVKKPEVKKKEVKKEVKKIIPKVISAKKTAGKKKLLLVVSGETCFWVNNGPLLCSMKDLFDALRTMSEWQFAYHTGMGRNDFSAWVLNVLGDKKCASDLLKAKDMKAALSVVEKHLKTYSV